MTSFSCWRGRRRALAEAELTRARQRLQGSNRRRTLAMHRVPQVPILLQAEPEIGRHPDNLSESQRRIRCHPALAPRDFVQSRKRNPKPNRQGLLTDPKRLDKLFEQHLARMCWGRFFGSRRATNRRGVRSRGRLVVVRNLDVISVSVLPANHPILGVDAHATAPRARAGPRPRAPEPPQSTSGDSGRAVCATHR